MLRRATTATTRGKVPSLDLTQASCTLSRCSIHWAKVEFRQFDFWKFACRPLLNPTNHDTLSLYIPLKYEGIISNDPLYFLINFVLTSHTAYLSYTENVVETKLSRPSTGPPHAPLHIHGCTWYPAGGPQVWLQGGSFQHRIFLSVVNIFHWLDCD